MRRGSRAWAIMAVLATGTALSLLIWAKLKIVASIPRSAYADPKAAVVKPDRAQPGQVAPDKMAPGTDEPGGAGSPQQPASDGGAKPRPANRRIADPQPRKPGQ